MLTNKDSEAIDALDLSPIRMKLMHVESGEGWTRTRVEAVEVEYRRFLYLMKKYPNEQISPSVDVDVFWHYHILDTMKYSRDCEQAFGYFLHHYPYVGMGEDSAPDERVQAGERMDALYEAEFGKATDSVAPVLIPLATGQAWCAAPNKNGAAWCAAPSKNAGAAWCAAPSNKTDTAWCAAPSKNAATAWCAAPSKNTDTAWCAAPSKNATTAWCAAPSKNTDTAWCAAPSKQTDAAWCAARSKKADRAWCAAPSKKTNAAWCAAPSKKANAAWCAAPSKKADTAWCAAPSKKADAAWCAAPSKQADTAWCASPSKKAGAAWCAAPARPASSTTAQPRLSSMLKLVYSSSTEPAARPHAPGMKELGSAIGESFSTRPQLEATAIA